MSIWRQAVKQGNLEQAEADLKPLHSLYGKIQEKINSATQIHSLMKTPGILNSSSGPVQYICLNIIKIAHGAIKEVYGNPDECRSFLGEDELEEDEKKLRKVYCGHDLLDIIWQARNQAEHYTQLPYKNAKLKEVFNALQNEFDQFKGYDSNQMKATEIIDMLGWQNYETFEKSILKLI